MKDIVNENEEAHQKKDKIKRKTTYKSKKIKNLKDIIKDDGLAEFNLSDKIKDKTMGDFLLNKKILII